MAGENYKHIFLSGPSRPMPFTNPKDGGSTFKIAKRERLKHSELLRRRLDEVWKEIDQRRAAVFADRQRDKLVKKRRKLKPEEPPINGFLGKQGIWVQFIPISGMGVQPNLQLQII